MKILKTLGIVVGLVAGLSGCRDANFEEIADASQVAAKVNGSELTVNQINQAISAMPQIGGQSKEEITNKILDNLIAQEVLLQQAMNMKLDRDPDALLEIQAAKKQILVNTYLKKVLNTSQTPSLTEIQAYFDENPQFFTQRKTIAYQQLAIQVADEDKEALVERIKNLDNINILLTEVRANGTPHKFNEESATTEKLPQVLVAPLYALSEGDLGYLSMDNGLLILQLISVKDSPISFDEAKSAIQNYLVSEKRKVDTARLVADLRETAQIEYVGDFKPVKSILVE